MYIYLECKLKIVVVATRISRACDNQATDDRIRVKLRVATTKILSLHSILSSTVYSIKHSYSTTKISPRDLLWYIYIYISLLISRS